MEDASAFWETLHSSTQLKLARAGIRRTIDLALHSPMRFEDETAITQIADANAGDSIFAEVEITDARIIFPGRRQLLCRAADDSGEITLRFFHFSNAMQKAFAIGRRLRIGGKLREGNYGPEIVHPKTRSAETDLANHLTPIYPTVTGIAPKRLASLIAKSLAAADLADTLPDGIRLRLNLPTFSESVRALHYPESSNSSPEESGRRRLKFDEWLAKQIALRSRYQSRFLHRASPLKMLGRLSTRLRESLPFELTRAQIRSVAAVAADLAKPHPMMRLLHGDVGSGKTIVAAFALAQAAENGFAGALMAPTEILAQQHFEKLSEMFSPSGEKCELLTGSIVGAKRRETLARINGGESKIIIGTHALFQKGVEIPKFAVAVVDEQHRFGVAQRLALARKGGHPHQLMMSATPIPRTLSMSFFADLDVSELDEMPPGRKPVRTVFFRANRRQELLARINREKEDGQVYWVCPIIEQSEKSDMQAAMELQKEVAAEFPTLSAGLIHGKMKSADKRKIMGDFRSGKIRLLIATTVVEVGVDAPAADVIVIEHPERFGLSQLHQLRGRVGRGGRGGWCAILFHEPLSENARERLKIFRKCSDGFEIAKHDLRIRGPGEWLGKRQSGMPSFRFADPDDGDLIPQAREIADEMLSENSAACARHLSRWGISPEIGGA